MSEKEVDPLGKDRHEPGAKLDSGKPRASLVLGDFSHALQAVVEVGTFGARKYSDRGWLHVLNGIERYTDAMLRHYLVDPNGDAFDGDSDLLHAAHLAWNALARLELIIRYAARDGQLVQNSEAESDYLRTMAAYRGRLKESSL